MNTKVTLLLLVLFAFTRLAIAQDYTFKVLARNGDIKTKAQGAAWTFVKTGEKLNLGDKLKLKEGSFLGLVHSSGKTLELTEAGAFEISDLSDKIGASSKNIVSKYADFVISKMLPEVVEENRKKYASVTGSGERGLYSTDIHLLLPVTGVLLDNEAKVNWYYTSSDAVYVIEIKNIFGETLVILECKTPSYVINFDLKEINEGRINDIITLEVRLKSDESVKSQEVAIKLLDKKERKKIMGDVAVLESNLGESSALNSIIIADFYEEEDLLLDAINSYESAINMSPDVLYFQEIYNEFLIRNQLKKPEPLEKN